MVSGGSDRWVQTQGRFSIWRWQLLFSWLGPVSSRGQRMERLRIRTNPGTLKQQSHWVWSKAYLKLGMLIDDPVHPGLTGAGI